jgi:hypothetical protein
MSIIPNPRFSEAELADLQLFAERVSPVVYLHPDEKYYPVSMKWLMENSSLVLFGNPDRVVRPITNSAIYDLAQAFDFVPKTDGSIIFSFGPELHRGEQPTRNVPCYVLYKDLGDRLHLSYIYVFAYNGEYPILGLLTAGSHPGDIEHMTLEFDKQSRSLRRVFYGAHGTKDGRWVSARDVPLEAGRPVAYNALNGHGLYPKPGVAFRFGGVANDYLAKGLRWDPRPELIFLPGDANFNVEKMGWVAFNGRFGGEARPGNTDGIAPLIDKNWVYGTDVMDEAELSPPRILSHEQGKMLNNLKNITIFVVAYSVVFNILKFIEPMSFSWKSHIIAIVISIILFVAAKQAGTAILKKYLPS